MPGGNPSPPSMIEKIRGKRTSDIRLPLEGPRDPRLSKPTGLQRIGEGIETLQRLGKKTTARGRRSARR